MTTVFEVFSWTILAYFTVLNLAYLVFTVVAWRELSRHRHGRETAPIEEIFRSPLTPPVSILLPAYNEEAGIVDSVRSLLQLRFPQYEVVVVDDGSTDGTLDRLVEAFELVPVRKVMRTDLETAPVRATFASSRFPRLVVVSKENGGKADALNAGLNAARYPLVCSIDADALLEPDALLRVVAPFVQDPARVVAAGGIVRIANGCLVDDGRVVEVGLPSAHLPALQVVEYFRAFLVGRVGWSRINALLIISGAFGLFDRSLVLEAGGYATDTVGEDMELVVRLHRRMCEARRPYRVVFVPDPVCWTEAPETLIGLGRQRRRWQRGLIETMVRHRRIVGNPRYGALGLLAAPYFMVFEMLGPVVELAGYLVVPLAWGLGLLAPAFALAFFLLAVVTGTLLSVSALALEELSFRRHQRTRDIVRMLVYAVVDNLGYRQLTNLWRLLGIVDVLRGTTGWGEMERTGFRRVAREERATSSTPG
jgi:cellulose synthase/poly-beta-1,6-N-acetylglucosamine synthase-like glycosyltransferase